MVKNENEGYDYDDETPPSLVRDFGDQWRSVLKNPLVLGGAGVLLAAILLFAFFPRDGDRPDERRVQLPDYDVMERMQGRFERLEERIESLEMELTRLPGLVHQVEQMEAGGDTGRLDRIVARIERIDERMEEIRGDIRNLESRQERLAGEIPEKRTAAKPSAEKPKATGETDYHVVEKGDTLFSIAKNNNIPLETLLEKNNLTEDSVIRPGDRLDVSSR